MPTLQIKAFMFVAMALVTNAIAAQSNADKTDTAVKDESVAQVLRQGELPEGDYTSPKFIKAPNSSIYPPGEAFGGREGWVMLNMMIDRQGKPYEVSVVDSTGNPALEAAATKWMDHYQFEPAKLNGEPVDAGVTFKVKFAVADLGKGASSDFVRAYRMLNKAFENNDKAAAYMALQSLKVQNLYEDAYYNFGHFLYLRRWDGEELQQLEALERAVAYERDSRFLPPQLFRAAIGELFRLQIKTQRFGDALHTYEAFDKERRRDPEVLKAIAYIKAMSTDSSVFSVNGEIPKTTFWFTSLLKRRFSILVTDGALAEIKLRCQKKYVSIHYTSDLEYTVRDEYGACHMEVIGNPGAKFILIQS